jgi:hypothetical protein
MPTQQDSDERLRRRIAEREQLRRIVGDYDTVLTVVAGSIELARRKLARGEIEEVERELMRAATAAERGAALSAKILAFSRGCDEPAE